jgi:putative sterol carrier protein
MAELLQGFDERARIQFRIIRDEKQLCRYLDISENGCQLHVKETDRPDFEIIAKEEVWWQIAEGSLAPLRAFFENKMRIRGNIQLGERFLMRLATQKGRSENEAQ